MNLTKKAMRLLSVFLTAVLLSSVPCAAGNALAAEEWPVWPRKRVIVPTTPEEKAAAEAGEEAGGKAEAGVSRGTLTKAALIGAGVILIGVAIGSGGGGGGGSTSNH